MNYIERALLITFIDRINTEMSDMDQILEDAKKTAKTIAEIQQIAMPQQQSNLKRGLLNMSASMGNIQPPVPMGNKRKTINNNEALLSSEICTLKEVISNKDRALKDFDCKLALVYKQVEDFRENFETTINGISELVFTLQNSVFETLSAQDNNCNLETE